MREAFFGELYSLAKRDNRIILLLGDVGAITLDDYRKNLPDRCINMGIAEENMMGVAAGLALSEKIVYVFTHAIFATTSAYEQLKLDICLHNLPVKIIGVGPGLDYSSLGPSHHATEDIALTRVLPNMTIFSPSDSIQAKAFARMSLETPGPVYIRLDRQREPLVYKDGDDFSAGFKVLRDGEKNCIIATGKMVLQALELGDESMVIDLYRIKPIDKEPLLKVIGKRDVITLEEHNAIGGIGSAMAELLAEGRLKRIGVPDTFCMKYGSRKELQDWILENAKLNP